MLGARHRAQRRRPAAGDRQGLPALLECPDLDLNAALVATAYVASMRKPDALSPAAAPHLGRDDPTRSEAALCDRDIRICGRGDDQAFAVAPLGDEHGLADRRIARALWPQSGLWPVVVQTYDCEHWRTPEYVSDVPRAIEDARTRAWPDVIPHAVVGAADWPGWVAGAADSTRFHHGDAPDPEELLAEVPEPNRLALERCLFEWEEARWPTSNSKATRRGAFDFIAGDYDPNLALLLDPGPSAAASLAATSQECPSVSPPSSQGSEPFGAGRV